MARPILNPLTPSVIYLLVDGDGLPRYVGQTVNTSDRFSHHRRKYSWIHSVFILERTTFERASARERDWIKTFLALGFALENKSNGGGKQYVRTPEMRARMRASQLGKKQSPETIEKRVSKLRGKKRSKEFCDRRAALERGKRRSAETRAKIRAVQIGRKQRPEHVAARVAANMGRKRSDEARLRMRQAQLDRIANGTWSIGAERQRLITFNGITKPISQWARDLGGKKSSIHSRLNRGWTMEQSLTTPFPCSTRMKRATLP